MNIWEPNLCRLSLTERYYSQKMGDLARSYSFEWPDMNDLKLMKEKGVELQNLKLRCINLTIFDGSPIDMVFNIGDNVHSMPCTTKFSSKVSGNMVRIHLDHDKTLKRIYLLRHRAFPGRFFGIKIEDD